IERLSDWRLVEEWVIPRLTHDTTDAPITPSSIAHPIAQSPITQSPMPESRLMKLSDLAEKLACRLEGDGSLEIRRVASLEQAVPGDVTFFTNPKYAAALRRTRASAVIAGPDAPSAPCAMLRT